MFQEVRGDYKRLHGFSRRYKKLKGIKRGFMGLKGLPEVTRK